MDLNQLYYEYQVFRVRAERARSPYLERECARQATRIAERIGSVQREVGAGAAAAWRRIAGGAPDGLALPLAANWNPA